MSWYCVASMAQHRCCIWLMMYSRPKAGASPWIWWAQKGVKIVSLKYGRSPIPVLMPWHHLQVSLLYDVLDVPIGWTCSVVEARRALEWTSKYYLPKFSSLLGAIIFLWLLLSRGEISPLRRCNDGFVAKQEPSARFETYWDTSFTTVYYSAFCLNQGLRD
jgi:hypothetical protein